MDSRALWKDDRGLLENPKSWKPDEGQIVLEFPIHYSQGLRLLVFQLLGFYCTCVLAGSGSKKPASSKLRRTLRRFIIEYCDGN